MFAAPWPDGDGRSRDRHVQLLGETLIADPPGTFQAGHTFQDRMRDEADAELLARSLTEPGAFASIFDRHYAAVRDYLASRIHDRHTADELAAEAFLHAFAARASFRHRPGYDGVRAWIFRITSNLLNDELRARTRGTSLIARVSRQRQPVAYEDPGPGSDPELLAALERVRGAEREALLPFVCGLS